MFHVLWLGLLRSKAPVLIRCWHLLGEKLQISRFICRTLSMICSFGPSIFTSTNSSLATRTGSRLSFCFAEPNTFFWRSRLRTALSFPVRPGTLYLCGVGKLGYSSCFMSTQPSKGILLLFSKVLSILPIDSIGFLILRNFVLIF